MITYISSNFKAQHTTLFPHCVLYFDVIFNILKKKKTYVFLNHLHASHNPVFHVVFSFSVRFTIAYVCSDN